MRVVGPRAMVSDLLDAELPWSLEEAVRQQVEGLEHGLRRVVEALAVYGRAASFEALLDRHRGRRVRPARRLAVARRRRRRRRGQRRPVLVLPRPRRRRHRPPAARPGAAAAARALLRGRAAGADARPRRRSPTTPRAPIATTRCRRSPGAGAARYLEKGLTFSALRLAAEGLSEAPNDPELLAVATEAAWRLDFAAEALGDGDALGEGRRRGARPHRGHALRRRACTTSSTTRRRRWARCAELEALWTALDDIQLRGVAARSLAQLHMISGRSAEAVEWAERALADARSAGDPADRGAGARRAGRGDERVPGAGATRWPRSRRRSMRPDGRATPCC